VATGSGRKRDDLRGRDSRHAQCRRSGEKGDLQKEPPGGVFVEPSDHGLGRSRGGLTSKIHLAVEQGQKPLSVVITAGQRGDSPQFEAVLEAIRVPRLGLGRPRKRPDRVRADKAYHSADILSWLRERDIVARIARPGIESSERLGRHRWEIERSPGCSATAASPSGTNEKAATSSPPP
jgi:hypothetical protein